jgi:hypothetical protein
MLVNPNFIGVSVWQEGSNFLVVKLVIVQRHLNQISWVSSYLTQQMSTQISLFNAGS